MLFKTMYICNSYIKVNCLYKKINKNNYLVLKLICSCIAYLLHNIGRDLAYTYIRGHC